MKAVTIRFDNELNEKINDYSETSGQSLQLFVTNACREKLDRIELEQELKDQEYLNK